MKQKYEGTAYIGIVGAETTNGQCTDSIKNLITRSGDTGMAIRATKGFEARQDHLNNFIASKHDFFCLLDEDMIFPPTALERLRSHGLPYISGLYMRRRYAPIVPIWFENAPKGQCNFHWWTKQIEANTLYPIGASGWGCMLIHREVIEAVKPLLKGEAEIIEDDMDIFPYDLPRVINSIQRMAELTEAARIDRLALSAHVKVLQEEIRPLRGFKQNVGSDVRFPFFAKLAGYQLMGDSGVMCAHMLNYPLIPSDFMVQSAETTLELTKQMRAMWAAEQKNIDNALAQLKGGL